MVSDEVKRADAQAYADSVHEVVQRKHNMESAIANKRRELGLSAVAIGEKVDVSPSADAIPDNVAELVDMVREYSAELSQYVRVVKEFERVIARLWPQYENVLELRYVQGKKWDEIAEAAAYSGKYIFDVHRLALIGLYDVMPVFWRRS